jgi:hypothetical protein
MGGKREEQSFTSLNNLSEDWFTSNETTQDDNSAWAWKEPQVFNYYS